MGVASKGFVIAMTSDSSGSEPKPKAQFCGYISSGGSFPTTKPDGKALMLYDYVRPAKNASFPFTVDGIEFTSNKNVVYYSPDFGWYMSTNGFTDVFPTGFITNIKVGGLPANSNIGGQTSVDVGMKVYKEDTPPSLSLNNIQTTYKAGNMFDIELKATVGKTDSDIKKIEFYKDSTLLKTFDGDAVKDGGTFAYTYENVDTSCELKVVAEDQTNSVNSKKNLTFVYPSYYGLVGSTLTEALFTTRKQTLTFNSPSVLAQPIYKYPASYGDLTKITDESLADDYTSGFAKTTETIGGVTYNVYTKIDPAKFNNFKFIFN